MNISHMLSGPGETMVAICRYRLCSGNDVSGFWTVCPGDVLSQITASRVQTLLQLSQKAEASDPSTQSRV
jgi:hypothetical protein